VDAWEIRQLYYTIAPHLVRQVELCAQDRERGSGAMPILGVQGQGEGFVLGDREGLAGYGHLMPGRIGHWLTILIHPRAYGQVSKLLNYGLALLNYYPSYPVYCGVREYQGGVRAALTERGFRLISTHCCLVKHTTVRVTEPARNLVHALEQQARARTSAVSSGET
jgi:hypothetical protein